MIYLGQPYSDQSPIVMEERYRQGLHAAAYCIDKLNLHVYAPIVHSHHIAELLLQMGGEKKAFDYWRKYDIDILRRCDQLRVLCLPGWQESVGLTEEIATARAIHLETSYMDMELVDEWLRSRGICTA